MKNELIYLSQSLLFVIIIALFIIIDNFYCFINYSFINYDFIFRLSETNGKWFHVYTLNPFFSCGSKSKLNKHIILNIINAPSDIMTHMYYISYIGCIYLNMWKISSSRLFKYAV